MLTRQDYDVLIEALGAWENKDFGGQLMGAIFRGLVCKTDEDRAKYEEDMDRENAENERKVKVRKERSVMLKAKLIEMRDSADADELLASSAKSS